MVVAVTLGALGAIGSVVGALGPWRVWTSLDPGEASGLELRGWALFLPAALVIVLAAVVKARFPPLIVVATISLAASLLAMRDVSWVGQPGGDRTDPAAGWGLFVFAAGAALMACAAVVGAARLRVTSRATGPGPTD